MDPERERVQADLRGLLAGEVRCDDLFLEMYASDASIYQIRPLAVVRPKGTADVSACVQYAAERTIPVHARGAGTSVAGQSLGPGIVLDFSHSMRRIVAMEENTVRVQPGVVHAQLDRYLRRHGRLFGPDPSTRSVTTMGSVLALDAAGSHFPIYGSARNKIVRMQIVLADGTVASVGRHALIPNADDETAPRIRELVSRTASLLESHASLIQEHRPSSCVNRSGYQIFDILEDGKLDLARLLVGSEGTLALFTEAVVKTDPLPQHRGVGLLFFDRLENAAIAALSISEHGVSACDLMDRRLLALARETDVRYDLLIPREAEAMLLVEFQGDDEDAVREKLDFVVSELQRRRQLAFDARTTMEVDERNLYWRLARRVVPTLYRLRGSSRPLPFVEDIAVPPKTLPEFLGRLQRVLKKHEVTATLYAHAAHGQLHIRPFLDLSNDVEVRKMQDLAVDLFEETIQIGGTISGEHGDGLSRTWFVSQQFGPLYQVFRELKRIFDPHNILNPGKIVSDSPQPPTSNLRPLITAQEVVVLGESQTDPLSSHRKQSVELQLAWTLEKVADATRPCNGCGRCRTQSPDDRMCPIFRFAPREEASPRAHANLLRGILSGRLDRSLLQGDALKAVSDLCVNCHQCRLECPAGVDIPKLVLECKAQYVANNGLRPSDWLITRLESVASWSSLFVSVANWALGNRQMRWLMARMFGIAQGRKLPKLAARSFMRRTHRRRLSRPARRDGRKVLYFVDLYANHFDVQLAEALVAVLQHNGVSVYVPTMQVQAGMQSIALGAVDHARRLAKQNVAILADAVRQGYQIIATEPAATLCLTHEYLNLLDDDDVRLVADKTSDACAYLWRLHQQGKMELDLKPLNIDIGYHLPCHMRALGVGVPGENLLRLIPGLLVRRLEHGCSGMAGTFGIKQENYRNSLRAGWDLITAMRDPGIQVGATECSTCKIQMEQGTTKPTIHPIKLLALSYGLMPEIAERLTASGQELTVT